jgi:hypothetical protein
MQAGSNVGRAKNRQDQMYVGSNVGKVKRRLGQMYSR